MESTYKNIEDLKKMALEDKEAEEFVKEELVRYDEELYRIQEETIEELKQPPMYD